MNSFLGANATSRAEQTLATAHTNEQKVRLGEVMMTLKEREKSKFLDCQTRQLRHYVKYEIVSFLIW